VMAFPCSRKAKIARVPRADPGRNSLRSQAAVEEVPAFSSTNFLRDRLLQASQPGLRHANEDVILQIGTAHSFAHALLPARKALLLAGGWRTMGLVPGVVGGGCGARLGRGRAEADPPGSHRDRGRLRVRRPGSLPCRPIHRHFCRELVERAIRVDETKAELAV